MSEWKEYRFSDFAEINPRVPLQKDKEYAFIEMKDVDPAKKYALPSQRRKLAGGARFENFDTLFARITPCLENGKTVFVDFLRENEIAFGSTEFIVMRPKAGVSPQSVYCLARDPMFRQYAIKSMVGSSGRQRVQVDQIGKFSVPYPKPELMRRFDGVTKPLFDKISSNRKEIFTLASLRDTLLPKLMSGGLRVGHAKQAMENIL